MNLHWEIKPFTGLSVHELYDCFRLRLEVFSVEQNCAYLDADGKDQSSWHVMGYDGKELVAYARVVPPGISFKEVSLGRVVSSRKVRGKGAGKALMKRSLEFIKEKYGDVPVRIGAQCYLDKFYKEFGFVPEGEKYLEDNIPHIEMVRNTK